MTLARHNLLPFQKRKPIIHQKQWQCLIHCMAWSSYKSSTSWAASCGHQRWIYN